MKILSLDTAMAACSAAVVDTDHAVPLAQAYEAMERGHAEALPPMVAEVMRSAGLDFSQIGRIAVTTGPGTFTGVRIGLSFARGLGLARGIPVIGIDSLTAIAANETAAAPLLVVSDARNNEVYAAIFDENRKSVAGPKITTPAMAAEKLAANARVIGTAARAAVAGSGRSDLIMSTAGDLPVAAQFARLAAGAVASGMPTPLYLRAPDARPQQAPLRRISALAIENVTLAAAPLLAELHAETFEDGWSTAAFEDLLRMPGAAAVIAREGAEPLAFLLVRQAADEAEIITIATRPHVQRRGVARQLLSDRFDALRRAGIRNVFLEVAASNRAALALYHAMGFAEAGRRKGYYQRRHGAEDAIVMRRELSP
jgi:tRNA threonylcarbamoyl adenosine modification protein YeaZ/ribosomal-protein-alanine acetyltransferase